VPGAPGTAAIQPGTNNSESEQFHRPFPAHACNFHKLGANKGPYMPSSAG